MTGTARRLARRYIPLEMRRRLVDIRRAVTSGTASSATSTGGAAKKAAPAKKATAKKVAAKKAPAKKAAAAAGHDVLVSALRSGRPFVDSVVAEARQLLDDGEQHAAASIAASLSKEPETASIGALTGAIVAYHRGYLTMCWAEFQRVPEDLRWRYAAAEYVRSGIHADRGRVLDEVRDLVAVRPATVSAQSWLDILGVVFGADDEELAREIFVILDELVGEGSGRSDPLVVNRDWLRRWVAASADSPEAAVPAGHVSIGIMDYGHPGRHRASANIGDHVQSLASLGHLVRHQDLAFHGPSDLVDLLDQLHGRVRPEMQRTGIAAEVDVMTVDRDASMYKAVPPETWTLAFGWFMHAIFEQRYGFPFHRNVLPIFLSFHCNKRDLLTDDALEYLREIRTYRLPRLDDRRHPVERRRTRILLGLHDDDDRDCVPRPRGRCRHEGPGRLRRHAARGRARGCPGLQAQQRCRAVPELLDERVRRHGAAGDLSAQAFRAGHDSAALLAAVARDRHQGRLPAEEPIRYPVCGTDRHDRRRVPGDSGSDQRSPRAGDVGHSLGCRPPRRCTTCGGRSTPTTSRSPSSAVRRGWHPWPLMRICTATSRRS